MRYVWLVAMFGTLVACGGASVSGPSQVVENVEKSAVQLQAPSVFHGRWATLDRVESLPSGDNVVILTPNYARDDVHSAARVLASRRLPAIVYAGHIYANSPSTWSSAWANFDAYLQPLRDEGVLVGIQPLDEPLHTGYGGNVSAAIADAHSRGYRVLMTEWADQVWGPWTSTRPTGVDWFYVTCGYGVPMWTQARCGERMAERSWVDGLAVLEGDESYEQPGKGLLVWENR